MRIELLEMSNRKNTILSELVRFFRRNEGLDARKITEAFLRTFTGTTLQLESKGNVATLPSPPELQLLWRDDEIAKVLLINEQDLKSDPAATVARRIELMKLNSIDFRYLDEIYRHAAKKHLAPPPSRTRSQAVQDAAAWIKKNGTTRVDNLKGEPGKLQESIVAMYGLSSDERSAAIALSRKKAERKKK